MRAKLPAILVVHFLIVILGSSCGVQNRFSPIKVGDSGVTGESAATGVNVADNSPSEPTTEKPTVPPSSPLEVPGSVTTPPIVTMEPVPVSPSPPASVVGPGIASAGPGILISDPPPKRQKRHRSKRRRDDRSDDDDRDGDGDSD